MIVHRCRNGLKQAHRGCLVNRLAPGVHIQLDVDVLDVRTRGVDAHPLQARDLNVRKSPGYQLQRFMFAR